uniref:Putative vig2 n=1 Tax=Psorophora albipes TaxID=869069 RepID=T1E227_9DIPT
MENTSYGINVANRYDLFSIDDEGDDPFQTVTQNRQKTQKKNQPGASTTAENVPKTAVKKAKNAEKENKTTQNKIVNNENRHPDKNVEAKTSVAVASSTTSQAQRGEKHGIRETQKDNIRTTREDANKNGYAAKTTERRQPNKSNFPGAENREERNNRKNRDVNNEESGQRKSQTGNRRTEIRGKREFDRQSGSNKTGVKAVEKRDGTGAHNWGSVKVDAKDYTNFQEDYTPQDVDEEKAVTTDQVKEEQSDQTETKLPVEEDLKEMTLDEWKAQLAAARSKPRYNLRKAGEGEDSNQWDNMVALDKKKTDVETEEDNETQKTGKQRQVLDIEFHFNDNRRGGMMGRSRGRGKGPRNPTKREVDKKETPETRDNEGEKRERRNRPPITTENQKPAKQSSRFKNSAPKVDDEHDFPSLG